MKVCRSLLQLMCGWILGVITHSTSVGASIEMSSHNKRSVDNPECIFLDHSFVFLMIMRFFGNGQMQNYSRLNLSLGHTNIEQQCPKWYESIKSLGKCNLVCKTGLQCKILCWSRYPYFRINELKYQCNKFSYYKSIINYIFVDLWLIALPK